MTTKFLLTLSLLFLALRAPALAQAPAPGISDPVPVALPVSAPASLLRPTKGQPIKIMPVGDSITEGKFVPGGYRKPLYQLLTDNGYTVTFVGKEDNGQPQNTTGFSGGMKSPNHEGYGSARIGTILNGGMLEGHASLPIRDTLANNNPDVVLLMLGTNDMSTHTAEDCSQILEKLVETIFDQSPGVTVILASIPPLPNNKPKVDAYNALVSGIVDKQKALNHKIAFADIHSVFGSGDMGSDNVHPSQAGYKKMASLWYSILTGKTAP